MILTGEEILRMRSEGRLAIDPFDAKMAGANSYDLTLSDRLLVYGVTSLDMKREHPTKSLTIPDSGLWLNPSNVYLGATNERCGSDEFVCCIEGRSSVGRLGVQVHSTAGVGDLGFKDHWTLEITVTMPVKVYPNVRICQALFMAVRGHRAKMYSGKYAGQTGPVPSRMWKDFL